MKPQIVFFGSSKYSVIVASSLQKIFGLCLIVTLADRHIGRKKMLTPSPVKTFALHHAIPVFTPESFSEDSLRYITSYHPDFFVVADYGKILPKELLAVPAIAPLNVHHSLLPKYRGPSPAPSAILANESVTGVSIIIMTRDVDAGAILARKSYTMHADETTDSLLTRLNTLGAELIVPVITHYQQYEQSKIIQDETQATRTHFIKKSDGFIHSMHPPAKEIVARMIRAYYPWPGVWTNVLLHGRERTLKFLPKQHLQIEGRNPLSLKDFLNGYPQLKTTIEKILL